MNPTTKHSWNGGFWQLSLILLVYINLEIELKAMILL